MSLLQNPSAMAINKALSGGHKFTLSERINDVEYRTFVKPDLLTNLLNPTVTPHRGRSFQWDVVVESLQKVAGKSYSEDGPSLITNTALQRTASIPAFGLTYELNSNDVDMRRKPGTDDKEIIQDLMAVQSQKMMDAYDIFNEDAMIELVVNDQNIVSGGPGEVYNWSTVYEGGTRAAATDLLLGTASPEEVRDAFYSMLDTANQNLRKRGLRAQGWIHVCGKDMFNKLATNEAALGDTYSISPILNLKVDPIPSMMIGSHNYRNFVSNQTGVRHVQYQASMDGISPIIGDDDGYLIPVGVDNMFTIELAPDDELFKTNDLAQPMYMYYEETRTELRVASATNRLFRNTVPNAIVATTTSN